MYPWDIYDIGESLEPMFEGTLDSFFSACSYHSLFAVLPAERSWPIIEIPQSALLFPPDDELWKYSPITPSVAGTVHEIGDARELAKSFARSSGVSFTAWVVCLHDTSLGRRYPDTSIVGWWGGRITSAPCLNHPAVRAYIEVLVKDAVRGSERLQLEAAHWARVPHHRHERGLNLEHLLPLDMCFCDYCVQFSDGYDLDLKDLAIRTGEWWRRVSSIESESTPWESIPGAREYVAVRSRAVTELVARLAIVAEVPVEVVAPVTGLRRVGIDLPDLERIGVDVRLLIYGAQADLVQRLDQVIEEEDHPSTLNVGLSILPEELDSAEDLEAARAEMIRRGAQSIGYYHIGLVDVERRRWVASVTRSP